MIQPKDVSIELSYDRQKIIQNEDFNKFVLLNYVSV